MMGSRQTTQIRPARGVANMKLLQTENRTVEPVGLVNNGLGERIPFDAPSVLADSPMFEGSSCRIVIGIRYHCELGVWHLDKPLHWDPNRIAAGAQLLPNYGAEGVRVQECRIRLRNIGEQPPINDERDVITFLNCRYINSIILRFSVSSAAMPDIGSGALIIYVGDRFIISRRAAA